MFMHKSKKGFTVVELVIVIAVIAILAAVLIPTFSGIVEKANESAELQEVKNAYTEALVELLEDGVIAETTYEYKVDGTTKYTFTLANGVLTGVAKTGGGFTYTIANGTITKAEKN